MLTKRKKKEFMLIAKLVILPVSGAKKRKDISMARIKQIGVGRKSSGMIDGVVYAVVNGHTIARSAPTMPRRIYETPAARLRQATWRMIQRCASQHTWTIRRTFDRTPNGSAYNNFVKVNFNALKAAFSELAQREVNGDTISIQDIEDALTVYATAHPNTIVIAKKSGFSTVYLSGSWPQSITLTSTSGLNSIVITCHPDGSTTTDTPSGGNTPGGTTPGGDPGLGGGGL